MVNQIKETIIRSIAPITLFVIIFILFAAQSLISHNTFNTHGFDLGVYTQSMYLYTYAHKPYNTIAHIHPLANHFEPILYAFVPIYALIPRAETLLILQALLTAASIFPVYGLIVHISKSKRIALLLTTLYITSSGILYAIIWDFHTTTISVLALATLLYAYITKKPKLYWITLVLALLYKEDIPIFLIGLGLFQATKKEYKTAFMTVLIAIVALYAIIFQITPRIDQSNTEHYTVQRLSLASKNLTEPTKILTELTSPPVKLKTANLLFGEYIYMPLMQPITLFTIIPYLLLRFISPLDELWVSTMHYNANLQPFLITATALTIVQIKKRYPNLEQYVTSFLLILTFTGLLKVLIILGPIFARYPQLNNISKIQTINKYIPATAKISAQDPFVPHLANRSKIFLFPDIQDADYIVLDTKLYPGFYYKKEKLEKAKKELEDTAKWKLLAQEESLKIYSRQ